MMAQRTFRHSRDFVIGRGGGGSRKSSISFWILSWDKEKGAADSCRVRQFVLEFGDLALRIANFVAAAQCASMPLSQTAQVRGFCDSLCGYRHVGTNFCLEAPRSICLIDRMFKAEDAPNTDHMQLHSLYLHDRFTKIEVDVPRVIS